MQSIEIVTINTDNKDLYTTISCLSDQNESSTLIDISNNLEEHNYTIIG
jgi:hypothetical protein